MARQLALGRLQGLGLQKRVEIAERDMRRDSAFKKIQYEEKARFDISYQREGDIVGERSFDFVRLNSRFLTLKYNKTPRDLMIGSKPNQDTPNNWKKRGWSSTACCAFGRMHSRRNTIPRMCDRKGS